MIFLVAFMQFAFAFESPLGDFGGGGPPQIRLMTSHLRTNDQSVSFQKNEVKIPIWKNEASQLTVGVRDQQFSLHEKVILPDANVIVPENLRSTDFNFGYSTKINESEGVGGRLSIGSSSDKTFSGPETTAIGASIFWTFPSLKKADDRWILSLNYSNNNSLTTLPIPGVAYSMKRDGFIGVFGLPFAFVRWTPWKEKPWNFTAFYLLTTINAEVAYGPPFMNAYLRFDWGQENWLRADRLRREDRLTFDEKRVLTGARFPILKWLMVDAELGLAFERNFFEGKSLFKKSTGHHFLNDTAFSRLSLRAFF